MLPHNNRLKLAPESKFKGRLYHDQLFTLITSPNQVGVSRIAFVVSKKISKKAVVRNKLKRRLRHGTRHFLNALPANDYLLIAKSQLKLASFPQIINTLEKVLPSPSDRVILHRSSID